MAEAAPDLHLASLAEPSFKVEQIGTTPEHPFYVDGKGWTPAGALNSGDRIAALRGPSLEVISLRLDETPATVYNLTVASDASFFVGELGAWGHNGRLKDKPTNLVEAIVVVVGVLTGNPDMKASRRPPNPAPICVVLKDEDKKKKKKRKGPGGKPNPPGAKDSGSNQ